MDKKIILMLIALLSLISGCYSAKLSANVSVEKQLNNPIMLDFVFVFDQPVVDELQKVPSSQWFAKRPQYKLDLELTNKMQILSYELVPGQRIQFSKFKPKGKSLALIIYASYLSQGDHRIMLTDFSSIDLKLEKDDFVVVVPPT